jgi:NAD(P)-dependent dehydrogenase (short-subunit alcohol dehydrogenase family)
MGVIYGSHAALRRFRAQGSGTLVNVGSMESVVPVAYHASYSASKAAVFSLGRALYEELRLSGQPDIHVATVLPWATDTPGLRNAANYTGREARSVQADDSGMVVDAIVWISVHPQETLPVGWKARGVYVMHHLLPGAAFLADRAAETGGSTRAAAAARDSTAIRRVHRDPASAPRRCASRARVAGLARRGVLERTGDGRERRATGQGSPA